MRPLHGRDAALLWIALGIWGLCFALHVSQLRGAGLHWLPFSVAAAPSEGETPRSVGMWSGVGATALRPGDELLAVGDRPLGGASRAAFVASAYAALEAAGDGRSAALRIRRDENVETVVLPTEAVPWPWRCTVLSLCFALTGAAIFVRARGLRAARLVFLASVGYAIHWAYFFGGAPWQTYAAMVAFGGGLATAMVCTMRTLFVFPAETARVGGAALGVPALFALAGPAVTSWAFGAPVPANIGRPLNMALTLALLALGGLLLATNYRAANASGRRGIKWLLLGFYAGLAPYGMASLAVLARPELVWVYELASLAVVAIPLSIGIAVTLHNLFDIDGWITRAASVTILSGVLLAVALFGIPRASEWAGEFMDPTVAQAGLSVVVVIALFLSRRSLEHHLGDWLFVERRRFESGIGKFLDEISRCDKPAELLTTLGQRLSELLEPLCVAVYARADDVYAPVFAEGPAVAPAFAAGGALVQTLGLLGEPVAGRRLRRPGASPLAAEEREALEAMGAELLLPVSPEGRVPEAWICLGGKRSGDVFRETERVQLARVADRAAEQFARFDREQLAHAERELVDKLKGFVPGAVRAQLERERHIDPGPCEVTVLFADLVAYTRFAESRTPDEIFSAVSRYTEVASAIVQDHGGAVVDFRGDGLMAVFGAPEALAEKETAALRAASAIVAAVEEITRAPEDATPAGLRAGVGVATGKAFVGTIRSIERDIWTVLGNTTNLAARLEGMTRDHDAAVMIDEETARHAGAAAAPFQSIGPTTVRGRSTPIELFVLPRAERGSAQEA